MKPIRKPATHELVIERIRRAIHLCTYLPGDRLPPEREIADQLAVSRESVRDAIKVLVDKGYLISRRGANGGLTVTSLMRPMEHLKERLHGEAENFLHLMEFRRANESLAARLAAERRDSADLARLRRAIEDLQGNDGIPRFRKADSDFHLTVAAAARNPFVEDSIESARDAIFLLVGYDYPILLRSSLDGHVRIFEAIAAGDGARAQAAMAAHIDTAVQELVGVVATRRSSRPPVAEVG